MPYADPDERRRKQREQKKRARASEPGRFREYQRRYRAKAGPPARGRSVEREGELRRLYNIGSAQYDRLLSAQGGVCAICGDPPGRHMLHVDHDHGCCPGRARSCGACIRGLLCARCNTGISHIERVGRDQVAAYLAHPPASEILAGITPPTLFGRDS